jgi:hypothetical protein
MPGRRSADGGRVLVTDSANGQNRASLAAVRALAEAGYAPVVATSARWSLAGASRFCAGRVLVPPVDDPTFATAVRAELDGTSYLATFAASDGAVLALDLAPSSLLDKAQLGRHAAAAGFSSIPERHFSSSEELREARGDLEYPLVVKPLVKRFGDERPVFKVNDASALDGIEGIGGVLVQQWIAAPMRAIAGVADGERLVAVVHQRYLRTWPVDCGVASAAVTTTPATDDEERLASLLQGFSGVFQAQFLGPHLIDLNVRVYGSLPLAVAAGVNLPALACDIAQGSRPPFSRGRPGVRYRWLEGDLRSVAERSRTGELSSGAAAKALLPRPRTAHSVELWADPRPAAVRLAYALRPR